MPKLGLIAQLAEETVETVWNGQRLALLADGSSIGESPGISR